MVISEGDVRDALARVPHPEIDHTLVELEMVKDIVVGDGKASVTLVLPFLGVPIRDDLVDSLRNAIKELGGDVEVNMAEMTQKGRETFMAMAQEAWLGT
jgi:ATP-binding protein involved in chromosome partitioning